MTKKFLAAIFFCVFSIAFVKAQVNHTHWKLSTKKVSDCEYDLVFTVTIDKGWHTFSVTKIKGAEGEVFPTEILFKADRAYTLVGNLTETKPTPQYDETINKTVLLHYNRTVYTQRIRLSSGSNVKITGTYENQVCNDFQCDTPPHEKFNFDLQGTQVCSK
jgi:thiol:disulfide interchange protein DsbD